MATTAPIFRSYDELQQDRARADYANACEAGIQEILRDREFAVIVPSPDSKRALIDFCKRYVGLEGAVPSLFILREAKKHSYAAFQVAFEPYIKPISDQRQEIIFEIVVLLASGGNMSEADISNEKARLSNGWTLEALRRRRDQVITAQRLAGLARKHGLDSVKLERAELRGDNIPAVVPLLPEKYTAQELKRLAREEYPTFKKLVRDFGGQVTSRLQGR